MFFFFLFHIRIVYMVILVILSVLVETVFPLYLAKKLSYWFNQQNSSIWEFPLKALKRVIVLVVSSVSRYIRFSLCLIKINLHANIQRKIAELFRGFYASQCNVINSKGIDKSSKLYFLSSAELNNHMYLFL